MDWQAIDEEFNYLSTTERNQWSLVQHASECYGIVKIHDGGYTTLHIRKEAVYEYVVKKMRENAVEIISIDEFGHRQNLKPLPRWQRWLFALHGELSGVILKAALLLFPRDRK